MASDDTKQRLLDVAQDLVQRVGANAMSYQDLSAAVGIRKASIHYHFPTKTDLLVAMIDRYHERFMAVVEAGEASASTGRARLEAYMEAFAATLHEDDCAKACACGMLGAEIATLAPEVASRLRHFYTVNEAALERMLASGIEDGTLAFAGEVAGLAKLIFAALEGGMLVARAEGGLERFQATTRQMTDMAQSRV